MVTQQDGSFGPLARSSSNIAAEQQQQSIQQRSATPLARARPSSRGAPRSLCLNASIIRSNNFYQSARKTIAKTKNQSEPNQGGATTRPKKKPGVAAPVGHAKNLLATTPTKERTSCPARPQRRPPTPLTVATACLTLTRKNDDDYGADADADAAVSPNNPFGLRLAGAGAHPLFPDDVLLPNPDLPPPDPPPPPLPLPNATPPFSRGGGVRAPTSAPAAALAAAVAAAATAAVPPPPAPAPPSLCSWPCC